jgi:transposase
VQHADPFKPKPPATIALTVPAPLTAPAVIEALVREKGYKKKELPAESTLRALLNKIESHRAQFIKRIIEFVDKIQLTLEFVYYPPYHSKYNPVEHCWGGLERNWSGALLSDGEAVREWTKSMRWAGVAPNVYLLEREYDKGVKLSKREMKAHEKRLLRTKNIERWSLNIEP